MTTATAGPRLTAENYIGIGIHHRDHGELRVRNVQRKGEQWWVVYYAPTPGAWSELKDVAFLSPVLDRDRMLEQINHLADMGVVTIGEEPEWRKRVTTDSARNMRVPGKYQRIPVGVLRPSHQNPRSNAWANLQSLAQTIRERGIIEPLVVRRMDDHLFEIICGERRYRAAMLAGLTDLPSIIREDVSDAEMLMLMLTENDEREPLTPLERADAYARLKAMGVPDRVIAEKEGVSRSTISNTRRLTQLPEEAREALQAGEIDQSQAEALLMHKEPEKQIEQLHRAKEGAPSRAIERAARPKPETIPEPSQNHTDPVPCGIDGDPPAKPAPRWGTPPSIDRDEYRRALDIAGTRYSFDVDALIEEAREEIEAETFPRGKKLRDVEVTWDELEKVRQTYSADCIGLERIKGIYCDEEMLWVAIGCSYTKDHTGDHADCIGVVPAEEWDGATRTCDEMNAYHAWKYQGGGGLNYTGLRVKHHGKSYVLTGVRIRFVVQGPDLREPVTSADELEIRTDPAVHPGDILRSLDDPEDRGLVVSVDEGKGIARAVPEDARADYAGPVQSIPLGEIGVRWEVVR